MGGVNTALMGQYCGTIEPIVEPSVLDSYCEQVNHTTTRIDADRYLPNANDAIKTIRLRFVFLQREGDMDSDDPANNIGGFHLNDPKHVQFWNDVSNYMNWLLGDGLSVTDGANDCNGSPKDTRFRFDVEKINIKDNFYWNNLNNLGNPTSTCPNCPSNSWYLNPLQEQLHTADVNACSPRINIFFTANATEYEKAVTTPVVDGTINFTACNTDCSMMPSAPSQDGIGLRVHMLDEYVDYLAQKLCPTCSVVYPDSYWYDESDAFVPNDWANNRYIWQVGNVARLILHELGHSISLPHTDWAPNWPFLNTQCNLMCSSNMTRNAIYDEQTKAMHKATAILNDRLYVRGCPYSPEHPFEVTGEEVWSQDTRLYNDVIVRTGGKLTVKCILHMPPQGRIIVERGAKLIVDGGIITDTGCECERWEGIEVWGNTTTTGRTHQVIFNNANPMLLTDNDYTNVTLLPEDPGMVVLINSAKIENGPNGAITTKKRVGGEGWNEAFWGGIVYANNATFDNNKRAVEFMKYEPLNYSRFIGTNFTVKDDYALSNLQGVTMWRTNGIEFLRCIFSHNLTQRKGEGVGGLDASFVVHEDCVFRNLHIGVASEATGPLMGDVLVDKNLFDNNDIHIRATATDKLQVLDNQFGITAIQNGFGVIVINRTSGTIQGNIFHNHINGIVALSNPKSYLNIECNQFYNTQSVGIWALGNNNALKFDANEFFDSQKFDAVLSSVGTEVGSWGLSQGSWASPRFNLFSSSLTQHHIATLGFFSATPNLFFNYYHPIQTLNPRLVPICDNNDGCSPSNNYLNSEVGFVNNYQIPECIDIEGLIGGGGYQLCRTKQCLITLKQYIYDLQNNIDGGDKEQLIADLNAYPNGEATFQLLYQKSPYLSDEVLIQIAKTTAMATWKRSNLLVINSPLSDAVMADIVNYVPAYTYQILESIRYYDQLSERGALESRISEEDRKKADILSHLLSDLMKQKDVAQIAELIADEEPEFALRTLTTAYLQAGNIAQAQSALAQIPIYDTEDQQFYDIQSINIQRAITPLFDLSPEQEAIVRQIANDTYSTQAGYAQGLLRLYRGETTDIVLPDFESAVTLSGKTQTQRPRPQFSADELNSILLFPNPANAEAIYYLPPTKQGNQLVIYDLNGNQKTSMAIQPEQRIGEISVTDLPNGIYIVALQSNNSIISQTKLLVAH